MLELLSSRKPVPENPHYVIFSAFVSLLYSIISVLLVLIASEFCLVPHLCELMIQSAGVIAFGLCSTHSTCLAIFLFDCLFVFWS
eukprot:m.45859 g.45859  ORF g.45859 m.45859 type:complete len:85 (+) comp10901_c0_seq1:1279-1533(+)